MAAAAKLLLTKAPRAMALGPWCGVALGCTGQEAVRPPESCLAAASSGHAESVLWVGAGAALCAQHGHHPPPPSSSICFPLLLVPCPAWCVLPGSACASAPGAWLCVSVWAPALPWPLRVPRASWRVPRPAPCQACAQPAPLCSQEAG